MIASVLNQISLFFIPGIITLVIFFGIYKKAPIYDLFIEGTKDGLKTAIEILPFIIAIFVGIEALVSSGAMEFLERILSPVFQLLRIPKELTSMILLRPVSGSGSLVLVEKIVNEYGPDSFIGRSASVMVGSCETVFYVLAVYFGVTAVKNIRHSLSAGLVGYVVGIFASLIACMYI
ncbi:MAG: nucleoside recognition domain-containing protein [Eubacteriales bacterium]|nr:nucleoside recognition domain-containing protein [Eubacteriales bacterium]MDD3199450.1 nucleoside recognition domain-containing protein [Eubacteriales bacterium]MDD4122519.1 nucleoside recognition domain-containing protein [Eubacteriales bacterium]MDD4629697.1 nucleoside recognition domain-containing protein [Eubacteriales bacterium]